ncbi:hypothetical protein BBJ28_00020190 [Nothophytophthora sp. Chile5]|nr:hypothetical protein BBJ28_00020190 [Nothophytophthora sp. Chile5]
MIARSRVLDAYREGKDWMLVAHHNAIPTTTARRIVERGSPEVKKRGGARASNVKRTLEIEEALIGYLEENCQYTLGQMKEMVWYDFGMDLSTSLISQKLLVHAPSHVRVEPSTCNNSSNIDKRRMFAEALQHHTRDGAFVIYYDETNFNLYCKRSQGRAIKGKRAVVTLPPSKGNNLQIQCAVSTEVGLLYYTKQRGSIQMEVNAEFVDAVNEATKAHETYRTYFAGTPIVIILDNCPATVRPKI